MSDRGHLDALKCRNAEQILVKELQSAAEAVRLANLVLRDITGIESDAQWPDSTVNLEQARAGYLRAHDAWKNAMQRWVAFVKDGAVPDDIGSG